MARSVAVLKCLVFIIIMYSMTMTILLVTNSPNPQPCAMQGDVEDSQRMTNARRISKSGFESNNGQPDDDGGKDDDSVKIAFRDGNRSKGNSEKVDGLTRDAGDDPRWGRHKMAVIVPFRDRFEELMEFAPYLHHYLVRKKVRHRIYVINQVDMLRFNRGSLINVGVREMDDDCDYIAMHDVDLLPLSDELDYSYPVEGVYHIAAPHLHPMYHYPTFIGGILLLTRTAFETVNGLSNRYWGWGREDDELYVRLKRAGLLMSEWVENKGIKEIKYNVRRPGNLTTGNHTFRHIHDKKNRPRDNSRYFNQQKKTSRLDRETGMYTVQYHVIQRHSLVVNSAPVTVLEVKLSCDFEKTPWCLHKKDHHLLLPSPKSPEIKAPANADSHPVQNPV